MCFFGSECLERGFCSPKEAGCSLRSGFFFVRSGLGSGRKQWGDGMSPVSTSRRTLFALVGPKNHHQQLTHAKQNANIWRPPHPTPVTKLDGSKLVPPRPWHNGRNMLKNVKYMSKSLRKNTINPAYISNNTNETNRLQSHPRDFRGILVLGIRFRE